ncbi:unnamed protein product, partial [Allacma fusca]
FLFEIALKRLKYAIKERIFGPIPLDEIETTSLYALEHAIIMREDGTCV